MFARLTGTGGPQLAKRYASTGPRVLKSVLPFRPLKKIRVGKARPAIYYKFDTLIEMSDGSVVKRRSQYPKGEQRMITDQRNNPIWNESKPDLAVLDAEAEGKLNKFKAKFSAFSKSGKTAEELAAEKAAADEERRILFETGVKAKKKQTDEDDAFLSILESNYTEQKLGGKLAQKEKKKKKKTPTTPTK